jgi:hypothetical protein
MLMPRFSGELRVHPEFSLSRSTRFVDKVNTEFAEKVKNELPSNIEIRLSTMAGGGCSRWAEYDMAAISVKDPNGKLIPFKLMARDASFLENSVAVFLKEKLRKFGGKLGGLVGRGSQKQFLNEVFQEAKKVALGTVNRSKDLDSRMFNWGDKDPYTVDLRELMK